MCAKNVVYSSPPALTHRGARSATTGRSANVRPCRLFRALSAAASSAKLRNTAPTSSGSNAAPRGSGAQRAPPAPPRTPRTPTPSPSRSPQPPRGPSAPRASSSRATRRRKCRDVRRRFHPRPSSSFARERRFCHLLNRRARARHHLRARRRLRERPPRRRRDIVVATRRRTRGRRESVLLLAALRRVRRRAVGAPGARPRAALIRGRRVRLTLTRRSPPRSLRVFQKRFLRASRRVARRVASPAPVCGSLAFARSVSHETKTLQRFARRRARDPQPPRFCARPPPAAPSPSPPRRTLPETPGYLWTTFAVRSRPSRARIPSYRNRHPAKCRVSPRSDAPNTRRPSLFVFFLRLRRERRERRERRAPVAVCARLRHVPRRPRLAAASRALSRRRGTDARARFRSRAPGAPSRRRRRPSRRRRPRARPRRLPARWRRARVVARRRARAARRGRRRDLPGDERGRTSVASRARTISPRGAIRGGFRARRRFRFGVARPAAIRGLRGRRRRREAATAAAAAAAAGTPLGLFP